MENKTFIQSKTEKGKSKVKNEITKSEFLYWHRARLRFFIFFSSNNFQFSTVA